MENKKVFLGHSFALFASFIWGITFVSSKLLLEYFTPLAIMVLRFSLAYLTLWMIHPKFYKPISLKKEMVYVYAGLSGVFGYFLLENYSLTFTTVSNTGLILAAVPLFVAITTHIFTDDEKFHLNLLYGFIISMTGIALIIYNGQVNLKVNTFGDFLAIMAGVTWAFYSLAIKKMDSSLPSVFMTRRIFFYGTLAGILLLLAVEGGVDLRPLVTEGGWFHLIFLGIFGSATCYVLWNKAIYYIGAVKTTNYIYLMPIFTLLASMLILHEKITSLMIIGCIFILIGVYVSENGLKILRRKS